MHNFNEIVSNYQKAFARCGVTVGDLNTLDGLFKITETRTTYEGRKKVESETKEVSAWAYALIVSSVGFFKDRVTKAYTMAGYLPVRFSATNPYSSNGQRVVREYRFDYVGHKEANNNDL